jgi:hypothetical protein
VTGPEHVRKAEQYLDAIQQEVLSDATLTAVATAAQAHATLALVAAASLVATNVRQIERLVGVAE